MTQLSVAEVQEWMSGYYLDPRPDLVPAAVAALRDAGHLDDSSAAGPATVFLRFVLRSDPAAGAPSGDADPGIRALVARLRAQPPPDVLALPLSDPAVLDLLWAAFMATGDERYVVRVIAALPDPGPAGAAARWSLESQARAHERVRGVCHREAARQPDDVAAVLREIAAGAEGSA